MPRYPAAAGAGIGTMERTQYEKILMHMARHPQQVWWYAPDFMKNDLGELFVGYEASARLSELAREYPAIIGSRRHPTEGKYMQRRIMWENLRATLSVLPQDLQDAIKYSYPGGIPAPKMIATYTSVSRPGTEHHVFTVGSELQCDCEAFLFCKVFPKSCKHIQAYQEDQGQRKLDI